MKQLSRRILLLLPLLTMLALGAWAQQEAVRYYQHEWVNDPIQGKYRLTNYSSNCTNYAVLNSSAHTDGGNFGVGAIPAGLPFIIKWNAGSADIVSPTFNEEADGNEGWYTLGGQRLSSRPVRKGIYVRQGRKVVIR